MHTFCECVSCLSVLPCGNPLPESWTVGSNALTCYCPTLALLCVCVCLCVCSSVVFLQQGCCCCCWCRCQWFVLLLWCFALSRISGPSEGTPQTRTEAQVRPNHLVLAASDWRGKCLGGREGVRPKGEIGCAG